MDEKGLKEIQEFQKQFHEQNKKRITFGLRCMYIIPAVFLVLMFVSSAVGSSKIVFLVLWIASLFIISIGMIIVEYIDYKFQKKLDEVVGTVTSYSGITNADEVSEQVKKMHELRKSYKQAVRLDLIQKRTQRRRENQKEDEDA